jgi:hypothetical protein
LTYALFFGNFPRAQATDVHPSENDGKGKESILDLRE